MTRRSSSSCAAWLGVFLIFGLIITYWYVFLAIAAVAAIGYGLYRLTMTEPGDPGHRPPAVTAAVPDPAVTEALAARARRDKARALADRDPLLARDLLIGRPDVKRTYDDGGLVDLNTASAAAIARVCGLDPPASNRIVATRSARGPFSNLDEVLVLVDIPITKWDRLRDKAIVLPD